jgi:hypothetical protein
MVEGHHEADDNDSLLKHKHCKNWQTPSHTSKVVTTNNIETLIPWSCWSQNDM